MKSLNKLFLALLATLAVGFVSMGFVACSDDDDEESALFDLRKEVSGTKVATYVRKEVNKKKYRRICNSHLYFLYGRWRIPVSTG